MKTLATMALLLLLAAQPAMAADPRTSITFNPVPCPGGVVCNRFHVVIAKPSGAVLFSKSFASTSMASDFAIVIPTTRGSIRIWSER